jgi:hypothetical protein
MFFLRKKPHLDTFDERLSALASARFQTSGNSQGGTRVSRDGFAADVSSGEPSTIGRYGVLVNGEIAELTDLGYQKIWLTQKGSQMAATAAHLRGLHSFIEDLREGLGLTSLYNEGLGSVNEHHLYDRVKDRDARAEKKPWEKSLR